MSWPWAGVRREGATLISQTPGGMNFGLKMGENGRLGKHLGKKNGRPGKHMGRKNGRLGNIRGESLPLQMTAMLHRDTETDLVEFPTQD